MPELNPTIEEIWKPIPGYEGLYEVSNLGRIKTRGDRPHYRRAAGDLIKNQRIKRLYLRVGLWKKPRQYHPYVHRLVALAFIGPPPDDTRRFVNHIDGNRFNNRADNLEWVSSRENSQHAARLGLMASGDRHGSKLHPESVVRGTRQGLTRLSDDDVKEIRRLFDEGHPQRAIARAFGLGKSTVAHIGHRRTWTHIP